MIGVFFLFCFTMSNIIQIEKGKYTALLRRVLGMQPSENGVSELQAIGRIVQDAGLYLKLRSVTREEALLVVENVEFAVEYFHLQKDELLYPKTEEPVPQSPVLEDTNFG